jgi:hypothetical protein
VIDHPHSFSKSQPIFPFLVPLLIDHHFELPHSFKSQPIFESFSLLLNLSLGTPLLIDHHFELLPYSLNPQLEPIFFLFCHLLVLGHPCKVLTIIRFELPHINLNQSWVTLVGFISSSHLLIPTPPRHTLPNPTVLRKNASFQFGYR